MAFYRIVHDEYCGFEVQSWRWWFPIWLQGATNTHCSVEQAERYARKRASRKTFVKYLGRIQPIASEQRQPETK